MLFSGNIPILQYDATDHQHLGSKTVCLKIKILKDWFSDLTKKLSNEYIFIIIL